MNFSLFSFLPAWLWLCMGLLSIISIVILSLRIYLFGKLVNLNAEIDRLIKNEHQGDKSPLEGRVPGLIGRFQDRFREASKGIEHVNTGALVDQVYAQEKIGFVSHEDIEYVCKVWPNLLLIFGLFFTFLGITYNLLILSSSINEIGGTSIENIIKQLQEALLGMSVAFTSSVFALFFSGLLSILNTLINTGLSRFKLLSSLEDYLDNIYLPFLSNTHRLDVAVERISNKLDEFLTQFGKVVRESIESALGDQIDRIVSGNLKATNLAEQVYMNLRDSSSMLSAGSDVFHEAAEIFQSSEFANTLAKANRDLANTQADLYKSVSILHVSTQSFQQAISELNTLENDVAEIKSGLNTFTNSHNNKSKLFYQKLQECQASFESRNDKLLSITYQLTESIQSSFNILEQSILRSSEDITNKMIYEIHNSFSSLKESINDQGNNSKILIEQIRKIELTNANIASALEKSLSSAINDIKEQIISDLDLHKKSVVENMNSTTSRLIDSIMSHQGDKDLNIKSIVSQLDVILSTIQSLKEETRKLNVSALPTTPKPVDSFSQGPTMLGG